MLFDDLLPFSLLLAPLSVITSQKTIRNIHPPFRLYGYEKFSLYNCSRADHQLAAWRVCLPHWRRRYTHHHCNSGYPVIVQPVW